MHFTAILLKHLNLDVVKSVRDEIALTFPRWDCECPECRELPSMLDLIDGHIALREINRGDAQIP